MLFRKHTTLNLSAEWILHSANLLELSLEPLPAFIPGICHDRTISHAAFLPRREVYYRGTVSSTAAEGWRQEKELQLLNSPGTMMQGVYWEVCII